MSGQDDLKTFREEALAAHNTYRQKHGAAALQLDDDLTAHAQKWANHLASTKSFSHSRDTDYGENIAMHFSSQSTSFTGQQVTDQWYSEIKDFNFNKPGSSTGTGHFSQVVWNNSRKFGIGKAVDSDGKVLVVGNYTPAGNMMGRYGDNVFPPGTSGPAPDDVTKAGADSSSPDRSPDSQANVQGRGDGKVDTAVSNSDQGLFQKDALNGHNEYRSQHGVEPLTLSDDLCKSALEWAQHLAEKDLFEHSKRTDIGENVAMHYSSATTEYSGKEACDQWYSELAKYDFDKPGFASGTGHFTQMVWKDSKELGIGKAITKDGKVIVVGQYRPPGNVVGRYEGNVLPRPDGHRPAPRKAKTNKVTRVVRGTQYVVEQKSPTMEDVTKHVGDIKLDKAILSPSDLAQFQQDALQAHNKYRHRHSAEALQRSEELERRAQDWAAQLAAKDEFKNSGNRDVGENIVMHYNSASIEFTGDEATDMFYRQKSKYNFDKPDFTSGAGHFTQLVWKGSNEFGIGKAITKEGKVLVVAFYRPPGNVINQFQANVAKE